MFRALWFARGFATPLPGYDQNITAAGAEADRVSWADHIGEFRMWYLCYWLYRRKVFFKL